MATKYARAGGGNWTTDATWSTTSGGAADTTKPTAADDAVIDAASGNVTIDSGAVCRSLDCNGYTGTLTHTAAVTLTIGDGTAGAGNRALRFVAGMTYTISAASCALSFVSSSATQQTIDVGGKVTGNMTWGAGGVIGSYLLAGNLLANHASYFTTFTLNAGTLATGGYTITPSAFGITLFANATFTPGSSAINCKGSGTAFSCSVSSYTLTVTANTAIATLDNAGAGGTFSCSNSQNFNGMSVVLSGGGAQAISAGGAFTVANMTRTGTAVKTDSLTISGPFTCTGTFTATGNSATNRMLVASTTLGTARSITAAAVSLTNVDFRDITGAGAATWSGTSIGNALGNTGITFTTPVTVTHNAGAAGNWSTAANWDTGKVPLCHDTVVIPATTTGTLTNDMPRMGADISFANGFAGTFSVPITSDIYGSLTFGTGMTLAGTSTLRTMGRSSQTITSAGRTWTFMLQTFQPTGTYTLADALTSNHNAANALDLQGSLNDGGFAISLTGAASSARLVSGTFTHSGTLTLAGTSSATPWTVSGGTLVDTGTIVLSGATATDRTFAGGGKTYGTLTDQNTSTGKLTITGANTFGTLNKTAAAACTLALPTSSGITITGLFNVNGASGAVLTLTGDVTKAEGTVSCDYLAISSSDAAGGATFYAGANSTDGGTNTGWIFGAPSGLSAPYAGGAYVTGALNSEPAVEGALVVT